MDPLLNQEKCAPVCAHCSTGQLALAAKNNDLGLRQERQQRRFGTLRCLPDHGEGAGGSLCIVKKNRGKRR